MLLLLILCCFSSQTCQKTHPANSLLGQEWCGHH